METTTSFDLNRAIQHWRENLGRSPAFRSDNLYELETHLRESIATLQSRELSAAEAFLIATKRIGKDAALESEFGKVNGSAVWLDRALWILIGAQVWSLAGNLTGYLQVLLNISLPKANEWLATYGLGKIPESVPGQVFFVIALPLTLLAGAKICFIIQRWAGRRGWSPVAFLLSRPRLLAGAYVLLCVSPNVFNWGAGVLVSKYGLLRYFGFPASSPYTLYAMIVLQTVLFAGLVMFIARKRLRLSKA